MATKDLSVLHFAACKHPVDNSPHSTTAWPADPRYDIASLTVYEPANCLECSIRFARENSSLTNKLYDAKLEAMQAKYSDLHGWSITRIPASEVAANNERRNAEQVSIWNAHFRRWNGATRACRQAWTGSGREGQKEKLEMAMEYKDERVIGIQMVWRARNGEGEVVGVDNVFV